MEIVHSMGESTRARPGAQNESRVVMARNTARTSPPVLV